MATNTVCPPRKSLMIDMERRNYKKNVMKILEASGIYRENLSDMWEEKYITAAMIVNVLLLSSCFL